MDTYKNIPAELRAARRWILWKWDGGLKRPFNPKGNHWLRMNDPSYWMSFEQAKSYRIPDCGLGFALKWQDGMPNFAVVDLDECVDEWGTPSRDAQEIIKLTNSYTEVSPSGLGIKIFCRIEAPIRSVKLNGYEILTSTYATVTGLQLDDYDGCTNTVNERTLWLQGQADWLRFLQSIDRPYGGARIEPDDVLPDGMRNESLFKHACSLRAEGLEQSEIEDALLAVNAQCSPPLPTRDVLTIARSASRYAAGSN